MKVPAKKVTPTSGNEASPKLPVAAVEGVHVLALPGQHADGHAASQHFAVGGQVRTNSKQRLAAARMDAEAGDDFVEDQRGAGIFGDRANFVQERDGLQVRMAALHRLDQHRGQVFRVVRESIPTIRACRNPAR